MRSAKRKSVVTMDDVALRAAVSQTTVSYVLSGRTSGINIPIDTRQRVLDAARDLGYRRNQLARAMVTGKSRILGVLTAHGGDEITMKILAGAMEAANSSDYLLKIMHLHFYGLDEATLARLSEWQVAGAMFVGISPESQEQLEKVIRDVRMPLAMVDNAPPTRWGIQVRSDDDQGIGDVVRHLVELGHRRIAFLGGRPGYLSECRERSIRAALAEAGCAIHEPWIRNTSWGDQPVIESAARAMLGESAIRPTAIVCSGDSIAMIVLRVAYALGLRVPDDLSVTGYSNASLSSYATPPLTTVEQPFYEMGQAAVRYLVGCDERPDSENGDATLYPNGASDIRLPTKLIRRLSTGPAPADTTP